MSKEIGDNSNITPLEAAAVRTAIGAADARMELSAVGPRSQRPAVTFIIDDGFPEDLSVWAPIFEARGFKCCCALVSTNTPGQIGNGGLASHLTMQAAGHEMLSHSKTHNQFPGGMSPAQIYAEVHDSYEKLTALGFRINGYVYPGNQHTQLYRTLIADRYKFAFGQQSLVHINHPPITTFSINRQAFGDETDASLTFLANYKPLIDSALASGGWLVFMMHSYTGYLHGNYQTELRTLLDYLVTKSGVSASASAGVVTVTANKVGTWGNSVTLTENATNCAVSGSGTLEDGAASVAADGTITFTDAPAADGTFVVNGVTYTFKAAPVSKFQVSIGTGADAAAKAAATAVFVAAKLNEINAESGIDVLTATEAFERFGNLSESGDISEYPDAELATNRKWLAIGANGVLSERTMLPLRYPSVRANFIDRGFQRFYNSYPTMASSLQVGNFTMTYAGTGAIFGGYHGSSTVRQNGSLLTGGTISTSLCRLVGPSYRGELAGHEVLWARFRLIYRGTGAYGTGFRFFMGLASINAADLFAASYKAGLLVQLDDTNGDSNIQLHSQANTEFENVDTGIEATSANVENLIWTVALYPDRVELWQGYKLVATMTTAAKLPFGNTVLAPHIQLSGPSSVDANSTMAVHSCEWGCHCPPF